MANQIINQLLEVLQNIQTHANNLNKDLDEKDEREETKGDLRQLFTNFGELRALMSKLDESDVTKLREELHELMSGKEDILEYNRDVTNILMDVKRRTEVNESAKDKVVEHLPAEKKDENVGSLFDNWSSILGNVQHWIEQNTSSQTGSR